MVISDDVGKTLFDPIYQDRFPFVQYFDHLGRFVPCYVSLSLPFFRISMKSSKTKLLEIPDLDSLEGVDPRELKVPPSPIRPVFQSLSDHVRG